MATATAREVHLRSRPVGMPTLENFEIVERALPEPGDGEIRVRNRWLSVDPYMRGRMLDRKSYVPPFALGEVMSGGAIGEVEESRSDDFPVGSFVQSMNGWRDAYVGEARWHARVDPGKVPLPAYLGVLGMTGLTAWAGLFRVGELREGDAVFVSGAAGAVGSVACQIAKRTGARVVGSAGGAAKCRWLREVGGVDGVIDYKTCGDLTRAVGEAFPDGIDLYFDNVGGAHLEAALEHMKGHGRLVECGMISVYNDAEPAPGPRNLPHVVAKSLRMQGFIVSDFLADLPRFQEAMGQWVAAGEIRWEETVREGIENAPQAFLDLFTGGNLGKMLVKV